MKNDLTSSKTNLSRLGRYYMKKNLYLLNRKNYVLNLKKILSNRHIKEESTTNYYIDDLTANLEKSIFDDDYENDHDKIIEKQKKKYMDHKDKYKIHSIQSFLISQKLKQKHPVEGHKLLLFPFDNFEINKKNINKNENSFDKISGRFDDIKAIKKKNNSESKICKKILNAKKIDVVKLKKYNGLIIKKQEKKLNDKKLLKKKLSNIGSLNNITDISIFPTIKNNTNISTITNKKISPRKKYKNKNIINSLENSKNIKTNVDFKKMLSRTDKVRYHSNEISNIYSPITPRYNLVHPKTIIDFTYKEPTSRKKDFSLKYRKNNYEFFFDLDKVYSKYNNHKETPSFSLGKIPGRTPYIKNLKEEFNESKHNKENSDKNNINTELNEKINEIMKLKIDKLINSEKLEQEKKKRNNILENAFQEIIKNIILNKEKKDCDDERLYKAMSENKINNNYMKLLKAFSEYKFLNEINNNGLNKL